MAGKGAGRDFDLMGDRVAVVTFEGTVQVLFLTDGWEGGARQVVANRFAGRGTAAELRAIADHLDALPWVDDGAVSGAGAAGGAARISPSGAVLGGGLA